MKILYLANIRLPTERAHGIQIMHTCNALAAAGAEVTLVVPTRKNRITENALAYYAERYGISPDQKNFSLKYISCPDTIRAGSERRGKLFEKVGGIFQSFLFVLAGFLFLLREKKAGREYDAIYSRHESLLLLPALFKTLGLFHAGIFWESHVGAENRRVRFLLPKISGVIVITDAGKKFYEARGVLPEHILVSRDGVDVKAFEVKESKEECREKLNLPKEKKIVGLVGVGSIGIYDYKGVGVFLEAARVYQEKHSDANTLFLLVGGGDEKSVATLKEKYAHKKWDEKGNKKVREKAGEEKQNILFAGRQDHHQLPFFLKACDVLVLPNKSGDRVSEYFTSPMKLFEYMASGVPILASDLPSTREVLDENAGMFFEPNDPKQLCRALADFFSLNKAVLSALSHQAQEEVKKYDWRTRGENIVRFVVERCGCVSREG